MEGTFHLTCCRPCTSQLSGIFEKNILLHLEPFQAVNLPLSTLEFLKPTAVSIEFSSKAIKLLNLLAK